MFKISQEVQDNTIKSANVDNLGVIVEISEMHAVEPVRKKESYPKSEVHAISGIVLGQKYQNVYRITPLTRPPTIM